MDFQYKLLDVLTNNRIFINGDIDFHSREIQRFRAEGKAKAGKPLFVIIHNGGASFGDWREPATWRTWWEKSLRDISDSERQARISEMNIMRDHKRDLQNAAKERALEIWQHDKCHEALDDHAYIKAKRIRPYYARQMRSCVILPVMDIERRIQSLQIIKPNGFKKFKKGCSPKGGMMFLAEEIHPEMIIRICEGYATACSIYEAIGNPVIVAFSAHNLLEVAIAVRGEYPDNQIHICGDNDQWNKENVGLIAAQHAAKASAAKIIVPDFTRFDTSKKPTDFNDLMCLAGIEEVENQLLGCKSYN